MSSFNLVDNSLTDKNPNLSFLWPIRPYQKFLRQIYFLSKLLSPILENKEISSAEQARKNIKASFKSYFMAGKAGFFSRSFYPKEYQL